MTGLAPADEKDGSHDIAGIQRRDIVLMAALAVILVHNVVSNAFSDRLVGNHGQVFSVLAEGEKP
jgi:hypothetical protein